MVTKIKYLIFKGIEKKEQILFKSFLNLAKNDLDFSVVVLKDGADPRDAPNIVIADENHVFEAKEALLQSLPTIFVGGDVNEDQQNYIARPVQWSDFKTAFTSLDLTVVEETVQELKRVLPTNVEFEITDMPAPAVEKSAADKEDSDFSDEGDYDFELDNMSIDYHSFTNSDYVKVVDDVKQFKEGEAPALGEAIILVTDDESASVNSVLVIETNAHDAWEFSVSILSSDVSDADGEEDEEFERELPREAMLERKAGFEISQFEPYWLEDNEIIADHETILFVKPERDMVYSALEPGKWPRALQNKALSRLPLAIDWKPSKGLAPYPMSRLTWVNTLISETQSLADDLDEEEEFILMRWPHFDLLELDNNLLKLCTMLFVKPETVASLATKSGYGRSTVRGLMNACYRDGILRRALDVKLEEFSNASNDESMFGKIKDVFR